MRPTEIQEAWNARAWTLPVWCWAPLWEVLKKPAEWAPFLSVIIPMALFNLIGSLQNIESAEAAGDSYDTRSSLAVNGIGSIVAGLFGSCFPTTIYIGHPGWKELGARAGYSSLNGLVVTVLCLTGTVALVKSVIPIEAGIGIVLWIGVVITAQAFQTTPRNHAPAVAIGLFPAIAAWGATIVIGAFFAAQGQTIQALLVKARETEVNGYLLHGLITLERGYIFICMILAAFCACLIDRKFLAAGLWAASAGILTAAGLCHAYQLNGNVVDYLLVGMTPSSGALVYRAYDLAIGYFGVAAMFLAVGLWQRAASGEPTVAHD